ncbi:MAG: hypothetical protein R3B90_15685 [Planctomycetaceae bacterium]
MSFRRDPQSSTSAASPKSPAEENLRKIYARLADGKVEEAMSLASSAGSSDARFRNAKAVCLMRLGRYSDAVQVLRQFVLESGGTWLRRDLPVVYKVNFGLALMLDGRTAGARDVISELRVDPDPAAVRLLQQYAEWKSKLSWWKRWLASVGYEPAVVFTCAGEIGELPPLPPPPGESPRNAA